MEDLTMEQEIITNACKQAQKTGVLIIPGKLKSVKRKYFEPYEIETQDFYHETTKELIIQEGIEEIGTRTFRILDEIRKVNFPRSLKSIGFSAFTSCSKLEKIKFPENIEVIGDLAFLDCRSLREVVFPDNCKLKEIKDLSFGASKVREIVLPEEVKSIGKSAFSCCYSLEKVVLPKALEIIDKCAFACSKNLEQVIVKGNTTIEADETAFYGCRRLSKIPDNIKTFNCTIIRQTADKIYENKSLLVKEFGEEYIRVQSLSRAVSALASNTFQPECERYLSDLKAICLEFPESTISSKLLKLLNEINEVKTSL